MGLDPNTLFFAAGLCSLAIALTILSVWNQNPMDRFLLWGGLGMILLGVGTGLYYSEIFPFAFASVLALGIDTIGFVFVFVGARQISHRPVSWPGLVGLAIILVTAMSVPIILGFAGIGVAVFNLSAALLLLLSAGEYSVVYREAPVQIGGIVSLYTLTGVSFLLCCGVILLEQQWVMTAIPSSWAEDLNAVMAIVGITGIGALSLSLTQSRIARRHADEARTDSLTGLLNRRALYDNLAAAPMNAGDCIIVFDLDGFKSINDNYGHTVGDQVLHAFSDILRANAVTGASFARIGGEEFVMIQRGVLKEQALATVEKICTALSTHSFITPQGQFFTTTSAGIAFCTVADRDFDTVFRRADAALYRAKDMGRNNICTELQIVA